MGAHQRQVTEQLVPADRHAGQVERIQLDLNDSHEYFAVRPAIITPHRYLHHSTIHRRTVNENASYISRDQKRFTILEVAAD